MDISLRKSIICADCIIFLNTCLQNVTYQNLSFIQNLDNTGDATRFSHQNKNTKFNLFIFY